MVAFKRVMTIQNNIVFAAQIRMHLLAINPHQSRLTYLQQLSAVRKGQKALQMNFETFAFNLLSEAETNECTKALAFNNNNNNDIIVAAITNETTTSMLHAWRVFVSLAVGFSVSIFKKKWKKLIVAYFVSARTICNAIRNVAMMVDGSRLEHFNFVRFRWMQQMNVGTWWSRFHSISRWDFASHFASAVHNYHIENTARTHNIRSIT